MKKGFKNLSIFFIFILLINIFCVNVLAQDANKSLINKGVYIQSDLIPEKVNDLARSKFQFLLEGVRSHLKVYEIQENEIDKLYLGDGFNIFGVENDNIQSKETYYFPVFLYENIRFIFTK